MKIKQDVYSGESINSVSEFNAHELDEREPVSAKRYESPERKEKEDDKGDRHE